MTLLANWWLDKKWCGVWVVGGGNVGFLFTSNLITELDYYTTKYCSAVSTTNYLSRFSQILYLKDKQSLSRCHKDRRLSDGQWVGDGNPMTTMASCVI